MLELVGSESDDSCAWSLACHGYAPCVGLPGLQLDPACVIDVQVAESSARKVAVVAAVKGPSRRLAKEPSVEKVAAPVAKKVERAKSPAPSQIDPPGDGDGEGRGRSRERKPPKEAADSSTLPRR